jgi:hypothetical protein
MTKLFDADGNPTAEYKRRSGRAIAIDNFLASLDGLTAQEAFANLRADAKSYGWDGPTRTAIAEGISLHFSGRKPASP